VIAVAERARDEVEAAVIAVQFTAPVDDAAGYVEGV
jgi:hypothetical protein